MRRIALTLLVVALSASAAWARSPLKPADMKHIRADARQRARSLARSYHARSFAVACAKTTPYSAHCNIHLARSAGACTVTTVYVVLGSQIGGSLARNGCG